MVPFNLTYIHFHTFRVFMHCNLEPSVLSISPNMLQMAIQSADILIFNMGEYFWLHMLLKICLFNLILRPTQAFLHHTSKFKATYLLCFTGLQMADCTATQFLKPVSDMAEVLKQELAVYPFRQIIFRNTLPVHYPSQTGGSCSRESPPEFFTNGVFEELAMKSGFKYLNSAPIYKDRGDMHLEGNVVDCMHWCYSPELIVPEIALLNRLLTSINN